MVFFHTWQEWLMYNGKCIACNEMHFLSRKYTYCVLKIVISCPAQENFYYSAHLLLQKIKPFFFFTKVVYLNISPQHCQVHLRRTMCRQIRKGLNQKPEYFISSAFHTEQVLCNPLHLVAISFHKAFFLSEEKDKIGQLRISSINKSFAFEYVYT